MWHDSSTESPKGGDVTVLLRCEMVEDTDAAI
jgi:hypothetical protein